MVQREGGASAPAALSDQSDLSNQSDLSDGLEVPGS
jgi:hypothetical protein